MSCRFDSCQAHFYSCESTPLQTNKSKTKDGPINLGMTVEYRLNNQLSTFYNHNIYLPGFLNQSETLPETNMFGKVTTLNAINFGLMNHFDVLTRHEPSQSIDSTVGQRYSSSSGSAHTTCTPDAKSCLLFRVAGSRRLAGRNLHLMPVIFFLMSKSSLLSTGSLSTVK